MKDARLPGAQRVRREAVVPREGQGGCQVQTWLQRPASPSSVAGDWRAAVLAIAGRHRRGHFRVFASDAEEHRKHRKGAVNK
jgi:hypothetical protein